MCEGKNCKVLIIIVLKYIIELHLNCFIDTKIMFYLLNKKIIRRSIIIELSKRIVNSSLTFGNK